MDLFEEINHFVASLRDPALFLICAVFSVTLYVVFHKKHELSWHAIQNTSATFCLYLMNLSFALFFFNEINAFAQSVYQSLHIPTLPADFWSGHLIWVGVVVAIVGRDFCDYLLHRAMHTKWGWPAHAAHHTDTHVNGFTYFRMHIIEIIMMQMSYLFLLTWLQLPQLIPTIELLRLVHNIYIHLDLDWTHGPLKYLIASPVFHRWHHADVPEAQGKNLANAIPLFDVIFGTYYDPGPCRAPLGALESGLSDKNPVRIWFYPFLQWGRLVRGVVRRAMRNLRTGKDRSHSPVQPAAVSPSAPSPR